MTELVWLTILLPLVGALVNGGLALRRPAAKGLVSLVGPGVLLAAFAVALGVFREVAAGDGTPVRVLLWSWMPVTDRLSIDLALQVDRLSTVMLLVITGVGSLIHLFSVGYMHDDKGYARYFAYLNLFVAFMLVLVLGASLPVSFIGWEGVGLCSYLLIGFWFDVEANANAGKKAFIANRIGDFGVLMAMFLLWWSVGTLDYQALTERAPAVIALGSPLAVAVALFLFLGCTGKSAQIPLYTWLPDAMAGPTPVSALIHAATMVTAGVFLIVRTGVLFALAPVAMEIVAIVGALTAFFAATIGLRQYDIKKVLAYSTVSQLGYMFLAVGSGAWTAGIFHLVTHAFFKALLFLGSGSVIHAMHHAQHAAHAHGDAQDMRNMGGLRRHMPWTFALMALAAIAIAGVPPLSGFFSKDEILASAFARGTVNPTYLVAWGLGLASALLTAIYMARLIAMTFLGTFRGGATVEPHLHEAPWIMTGPLVVLGVLSAVGGVLNLPAFAGGSHLLDHWLEPVTAGANALLDPLHLPHGTTELLLVGGAVAIALLGLAIGFVTTLRATIVVPEQAPPERGLWRILHGKYFVDELYQRVFVGPTIWISEHILHRGFDRFLVDRMGVGGTARLAQGLGWLGSRLQNGQVALYVTLFVVGAVLVLRAMTGS
ncbi:MAG TPA: NADH-quinone oxidoreductase subunit L [Gemmatimonadales bacterium]|nr:NADH-quinone oxidoreductase subunit L [Gemmatimonadales bacterium]